MYIFNIFILRETKTESDRKREREGYIPLSGEGGNC